MSRCRPLVAIAIAVGLLAVGPVLADEEHPPRADEETAETSAPPEERPEQPILGAARSSGGAHSLADLARSVKLKEVGSEGGAVEITDTNLKQIRGGGTMSISGTATTAPPLVSEGDESAQKEAEAVPVLTPGEEALQRSYEEQLAKVDSIEKGLADFNQRVEQQRSQPYASTYAQNRAPGTRNQNNLTAEKVQADLAAEKAKLEALRSQASDEGYELRDPKPADGSSSDKENDERR
jgi:hypothetical protein